MNGTDRKEAGRKILILFAVVLLLDIVLAAAGLWKRFWLYAILINLISIGVISQWGTAFVAGGKLHRYERFLSIGFPLVMLFSWEMLVRVGILNPMWFPPPSEVAKALWELSTEYDKFNETSLLGRPWLIPEMYREYGWEGIKILVEESHLIATLTRIFLGFIFGSIPGLIIGVTMGMSRTIRAMLDPVISAMYVIPKITILPLMMLIFSPFGETYKIVTVAISVFFVVLINSMVGVREVEPILIEAGRNYGARGVQLFKHVIVPGAMPVIFGGLRLALGTALIVIVAIEFVRAKSGVGYITWYYWEILKPPKMYAGLIVIMILGIILTYGLQWTEKLVIPWRKRRDEAKEQRMKTRAVKP
ncbi:MAG: ABC transporter permease [Anaerolineales bacterium]|nr:ABC transporter permease [Anaerolineales bacterium]